jgi:tRNA (guanine37-N1)-methyltransferase
MSIEINPVAVKYFKENIKLNKIPKGQITVKRGDCKTEVPKLRKKFDRIIMVLPESNWDYINLPFKVAGKGAMVHFYIFEHKDKIKEADDKIRRVAKENKRKVKIVDHVRSGTYARDTYRWRIDFKIL